MKHIRLITVAFVALAALFASTSAINAATISLSPQSGNLSGPTQIDFLANTQGAEVTTIQVVVDITGDIPSDLTVSSVTPSGLNELFTDIQDSAGGKRVAISLGVPSPSQRYSNNTPTQIGSINFSSPASGNMTIAFDSLTKISQADSTNLLTNLPANASYAFANQTDPTPEPSPTPPGNSSPGADMFLLPTSGSSISGNQSVQVLFNTGGEPVSSIQFVADITGNLPADMTVSGVDIPGLTLLYSDIIDISRDNPSTHRRVALSYGITNPNQLYATNQDVTMGSINFTAPNSGTMELAFSNLTKIQTPDNTNLISTPASVTYNLTQDTGPTPIPITPTITPPTINSGIDLMFRLEGVVAPPPSNVALNNSIRLQLKFPNTLTNAYEKFLNLGEDLTIDASGVHLASNVDVPSGTYRVCLKGVSHLQKCFDNITMSANQVTPLHVTEFSNVLPAGDTTNDNVITIEDQTNISTGINLGYPTADMNDIIDQIDQGILSPQTRWIDINKDGVVSVEDRALGFFRYTSFSIPGDE